jgi:D-alanyl-D-alanine carboxypeptidase/D-alanyl-D-alanine-endopeptidase (penicillin-binding protein 4)
VLYRHLGEPLDRVLVIINKPSQNFYADQLLRIMGRHFGREGSFRAGENVVRDFLTSTGLSLAEARTLRMADGSGLSRQNSVTPQMTLDLLMEMARHQNFDSFSRSLPIAGKDGTLGSRLRGTPLEGRVLAKTGTINGVRCLSGYLTTTQHRRLAFVLMANNFSTPVDRVNTAIDRFLILALSLD